MTLEEFENFCAVADADFARRINALNKELQKQGCTIHITAKRVRKKREKRKHG